MAKKSKKKRIILIVILIIVAIVVLLAVRSIKVASEMLQQGYTVVEVERQDMQTTVRGSGVIESQNKVEIYAPANFIIAEVFVENGDLVNIGDPIARIDADSYLDTENAIQDSITQIDQNISSMYSTAGDKAIYSTLKGTVKKVYAESNNYVEALVNEHGSLIVISADNNMRVELAVEDASIYKAGELVLVNIDEEAVEAHIVEVNQNESSLKIIFSDNKCEAGKTVSVLDEAGNEIGSAPMLINVPVYVSGNAGIVNYVYVNENDAVSRGTKLLSLKENEVSGSLIELTEEKAQLEGDLENLREGMKEIGLGSEYIIYSTAEGIVDELAIGPYTTVAEGMKMLDVQSTQPLMMYVQIDELDISKIKQGQEVELKFEALPGETYKGEITKINSLGQSVNGVTNYTIKVTLEETGNVLIGMSGNASILTEEKKNVLTVPVEAVQLIDDEYYVIMGEDANIKTIADRKIETGINDGAYIEVIEGLTDGDTVAIPVEIEDLFGMRQYN